jgi:hypothetical protein
MWICTSTPHTSLLVHTSSLCSQNKIISNKRYGPLPSTFSFRQFSFSTAVSSHEILLLVSSNITDICIQQICFSLLNLITLTAMAQVPPFCCHMTSSKQKRSVVSSGRETNFQKHTVRHVHSVKQL